MQALVWWHGGFRCSQAEGFGRRERHSERCRFKKVVTPDVKRGAVAHVCKQHGVSQRRACEVLTVDRSSVRYGSIRPDDADIREAMKLVAFERRRFG